MSNLSNDSRDTVLKPTASEIKSELDPMEVLVTFNDGARFQFRILVPLSVWYCDQNSTQRDLDLASWFSGQKILACYEISRYQSQYQVSTEPTFINMTNVSEIREMPI